ncbi:MAG: hypothetical protein U0271_30500 [Polyangiaceae bacterium]
MRARLGNSLALLLALAGCSSKPAVDTQKSGALTTKSATPPATSSPAPLATTSAPAPAQPVHVWRGLRAPESVLVLGDRILVSNVAGEPLKADNDAFISELSADGTVKRLDFIEAGKGGVALDAPKGMAVSNGTLFVADIDRVRKFDVVTGAPRGEVRVDGATFLNDVVAAENGVYVSDSGEGTDAIYFIDGDSPPKVFLKGAELHRPNGLAIHTDGGLLVATFGSDELFLLAARGSQRVWTAHAPQGSLDGVAWVEHGALVSSWDGAAVYWAAVTPDPASPGSAAVVFTTVLSNVSGPADLAYDAARKWIWLPRMQDDVVEAYAWSPPAR